MPGRERFDEGRRSAVTVSRMRWATGLATPPGFHRKRRVAVLRASTARPNGLVDVIGLPWEEVHAEACRWEHVMKESRVTALVKVPTNSTTPSLATRSRACGTWRGPGTGADDANLVRLTDVGLVAGRSSASYRARSGRHRPSRG